MDQWGLKSIVVIVDIVACIHIRIVSNHRKSRRCTLGVDAGGGGGGRRNSSRSEIYQRGNEREGNEMERE